MKGRLNTPTRVALHLHDGFEGHPQVRFPPEGDGLLTTLADIADLVGSPLPCDMAFPVSEDVIALAESALGRRLPEDLRARLARSNGGDISTAEDDWTLIPVRDHSDRKRLSRTSNDMIYETAQARKWHGFSKDGIAVASNGGGDFLVLLPGTDDVHHWEHETGAITVVEVDWT